MVQIDDKNKIDGVKQIRLIVEICGDGDNQSYILRAAENGMVISVSHNQVEFLADVEKVLTAFNTNV